MILKNCPTAEYSRPIVLDHSSFIVATFAYAYAKDNRPSGIYKYNSDNNEWILLYQYSSTLRTTDQSISITDDQSTIYMHNSDKNVIKINLKEQTCQIIKTEYKGSFGASVCINNIFHSFGGWNHSKHLIFDDKKEQFEEQYSFKEYPTRLIRHDLVYLKRKGIVLIVGGKSGGTRKDAMYSYDVHTKETKLLPTKLPHAMAYMALVATYDEHFAILIGGDLDAERLRKNDNIYVLDLNTMVWRISSVKYSGNPMVYAVILGDKQRSDIVVYGFVRNCWKDNVFKNVMYLPNELTQLLTSFYCIEIIHIIEHDTVHYTLSVDQILQ